MRIWLALILAATFTTAHAATQYEGVAAERPQWVTLGSGNIVCPGHPTQWVAALVFAADKIATDPAHRYIGVCAYCESRNLFDDPACRGRWFSLGEIMQWWPDRQWQVGVGGPCNPGTSADATITVQPGARFATGIIGGCNSGPRIEAPAP